MIDLVEQHGVLVVGMTGFLDMTTDAGIGMARNEVNQRNQESRNTSRRVSAGMRKAALKGHNIGGGRRPFGWQADKIHRNPEEAEWIKTAASWARSKALPSTIARRLNERGVSTVSGGLWISTTVAQMLTNPRLCGKRTYHGVELKDLNGDPVRGVWEPILTDEQFEETAKAIKPPSTTGRLRSGRGQTTKHLLSPFVRCECGAKMVGGRRPRPKGSRVAIYRCRANGDGGCGGNSRLCAPVDELITALVIADHRRRQFRKLEQLAPWPGEAELAAVTQQIADTTAGYRARKLSAAVFFPLIEELETDQRCLKADRLRHAAGREARGQAIADLDRKWADPEFSLEQRQAATGQSLLAVIIHKAGQGRRFDPDLIEPVWREDPYL